ncbi:glycosyltransferase family 4 protein [Cyanobium sp. HWJ4-Hawea]|uniref:hypothetical protein n=1 Tax=Cyanobium sp. HWJ4-Hawea TaxID=2823713 RepID=UPI0020CDED0D|nr:hypothetical protein [Cyanobium sp. HWJ4-Hawea]MCP9809138.1 glycosyltransferase family 4 protein [Cyanobium sp. HWJ4-Hawea]
MSTDPSSIGRFFFVCYPDSNHPIGGVKQIYRQVDLLHQAGVSAWVLHENKGFCADWFESKAPVIDFESFLALSPDPATDCLVLPETWVANIPGYLPGIPKIIFNQNAYYTFGLDSNITSDIISLYRHPDVRGVVTVSEDNRRFLIEGCGLDANRVQVVLNGIDGKLFFPPERKIRKILYLSRKQLQHARIVRAMAECRPFFNRYPFVEVGRLTHSEIAAELREALVFLSCGHPEGFGLPLAEAIACGCLVVGYHGLSGRDFCHPALREVPFGDLLTFVDTLENTIRGFEADPAATTQLLVDHAVHLRERYSLDHERLRCLAVWPTIFNQANVVAG